MDAIRTPEHLHFAPGRLIRAPECALYGCSARAAGMVHAHGGISWVCREHFSDAVEGRVLWPAAPV